MFDRLLRRFMASAGILALRILALGMTLLGMAPGCGAQLPAPAPIADPADRRFAAVTEILTSPSLAGSNLTVLNGAQGLGEIITGLVGQGLAIFDTLKSATVHAEPALQRAETVAAVSAAATSIEAGETLTAASS